MGRLWSNVAWLWRSSTLRLSLLLSVIFACGMALAIFVALTLGQNALEDRVDDTLIALAGAAVLDDAVGQSTEMILRPPNVLTGLPRPFARAAERGGGTVELGGPFLGSDIWRVLVTPDSQGTPILIALPLEESSEAQDVLAGILLSMTAFVVAATLAIGLTTGLWAQRRLGQISRTLTKLGQGDLQARTGGLRGQDDLAAIANELDQTAGALERLVAQTRHLSASIAHDLRTPLARLRAQLEDLPNGAQKEKTLQEANRLSEIFDAIMRLARIEAGQGKEGFDQIDLGVLATDVAEIFEAVVEDAGKQLILSIVSPATIEADRAMLLQALANLIQNAIVHGGDDIGLSVDGTHLSVWDTGVGVPRDQYQEVLKPMVRGDAARTRHGSGLGLAIVRAVADRHGAALKLSAKAPSGFMVSLNFANL